MNSKFKKWLLRSLLACGVALVLLIGCLAWQSPGKTAPMIDESGKPKPGSVAQLEQVTLGGMPQWVLMRGEDNRKPVLLVLHGGPGTAEMLMMREYLFELEKHFVVVNWDQLGAGKSYSADIPPHLLSVDQFVASTIELATWLRQRFKQDKIYLMGHSWGSILGIKAIKKRPELFAAYIGVGQFVNFVEGERASYEYALRTSKERHIAEAVQELEAIGPPPYADDDDLKSTATERKWIVRFGGDTYGKTGYGFLLPILLNGSEYTLKEKVRFAAGIIYSLKSIWPTLGKVDFFTEAGKVDVPVYLCAGRHDHTLPTALVERYFAQLQTPRKHLMYFENSAHNPHYEEADKFVGYMVDTVLSDSERSRMSSL